MNKRYIALMLPLVLGLSTQAHAFELPWKKKDSASAAKVEEVAKPARDRTQPQAPVAGGRLGMLDTNGDGFVSQDEFLKMHIDRFKALDANGDGKLTEAELNPPPPQRTKEEEEAIQKLLKEREAHIQKMREEALQRRGEAGRAVPVPAAPAVAPAPAPQAAPSATPDTTPEPASEPAPDAAPSE